RIPRRAARRRWWRRPATWTRWTWRPWRRAWRRTRRREALEVWMAKEPGPSGPGFLFWGEEQYQPVPAKPGGQGRGNRPYLVVGRSTSEEVNKVRANRSLSSAVLSIFPGGYLRSRANAHFHESTSRCPCPHELDSC